MNSLPSNSWVGILIKCNGLDPQEIDLEWKKRKLLLVLIQRNSKLHSGKQSSIKIVWSFWYSEKASKCGYIDKSTIMFKWIYSIYIYILLLYIRKWVVIKTYVKPIIRASIQIQLTCRSCISWKIPDDSSPQIQCTLVSGERGPYQREASPGGLQGLLQLNWQSLSASSGGWKSAATAPIEPWGSSTRLQLWCKTTLHHPALKISMASAPQTLT